MLFLTCMGGIDEILKEIAGNGLINIYEKTALDEGEEKKKPFKVAVFLTEAKRESTKREGVRKELIHDREMYLADCSCSYSPWHILYASSLSFSALQVIKSQQ